MTFPLLALEGKDEKEQREFLLTVALLRAFQLERYLAEAPSLFSSFEQNQKRVKEQILVWSECSIPPEILAPLLFHSSSAFGVFFVGWVFSRSLSLMLFFSHTK